jgi:hypothetical protein
VDPFTLKANENHGTAAAPLEEVTVKPSVSSTADSTNIFNFAIEGTCVANDSVIISTSVISSKTVACSTSGQWSTTLNVASLNDGTYPITVTSVAHPSLTASINFTKTTAPTCVGGPTVFSTNMNARYVIGQANFVENLANRGGVAAANTLNNPIGIVVKNGKLYVADAGNNRVLVYNTLPTSNGVAANEVIGQPNFSSTASGTSATTMAGIQQIAVDGNYLAVAEWSNARISFWPLTNPTSASFVWGQPNATSNTVNNGGIGPTTMGAPAGIAYASGKFFVGDATNSRVMIFDSSSISTGQAAVNVLGQMDFTGSATGGGMTGFGGPYSVSTDGAKLAVMDNNQDRILIYNSIPMANGAAADVAWGGYGVTSTGLNNPVGVFIGDQRLFIADRSSDRVLVFNTIPTSAAQPADAVIGQTNFLGSDHNQCACTTAAANTLWGVHHVYWDGCRLYVTDKQNNRVLVY